MGDVMFKKLFDLAINTLYPDNFTCNFCHAEIFDDNGLTTCKECDMSLPKINGNICHRCGDLILDIATYCEICKFEQKAFEMNRSVFLYDGDIKNAIRSFKFDNAKYWHKSFAHYLAKAYKQYDYNCDIICYVPMYKDRQISRGYNQSELLATELGHILKIDVSHENLVKCKDTKNQVDLNFKQRRENLSGAFKVLDKSKFKGKNILLVDDVYTTGSTLNNCSMVLKKAGAKNVYCLTIAHAHQKD